MEEKYSFKVLIISSGSVATLKVPILAHQLKEKGCDVKLVLTERSSHFLEVETPMPDDIEVLRDMHEWSSWQRRGDPVMHIDLMRWADMLLLAPLSANTLAKIANGLCDNLATCVARAWPVGKKPAVFCPAMNTHMWDHPVTAPQVATLRGWGYNEVPCISKTLVCGDKGLGAMAEVATIVDTVLQYKVQHEAAEECK